MGLDGRLELGPAGEAQLAGDDQLGGGQGDGALECTRVVAGEALDGVGIAAAGGVAQLLGLAAQLVEVGALGKRSGHGVSLLRLRSAAQAEEEANSQFWDDLQRWTQSFPRTRRHPPAPTSRYPVPDDQTCGPALRFAERIDDGVRHVLDFPVSLDDLIVGQVPRRAAPRARPEVQAAGTEQGRLCRKASGGYGRMGDQRFRWQQIVRPVVRVGALDRPDGRP